MTSIQPFLMFQGGDAGPAMDFYVELFGGSIEHVQRYGTDGPGAPGTIVAAAFVIAGQTILCSDSPIKHGFDFTPSSSLFVDCDSETDIRRFAEELADRGDVLMPLDNYGFGRLFTWVNDRFGVSWQLNLK
jgi:predicted 3-demethylubiquinone-9 3-methyltransferase (glyoxalase superfamily)